MYFKYFRIFPDFVRNKSFWIVTAIAVILGIWVIYLNKRTVTIEIDFGGMKCTELISSFNAASIYLSILIP
jgi:hypothetical protein